MPLYEYKCNECEEVFFELRSMAEREAPIACPDCGSEAHVLISQVSQGKSDSGGPGSCTPGGT